MINVCDMFVDQKVCIRFAVSLILRQMPNYANSSVNGSVLVGKGHQVVNSPIGRVIHLIVEKK